MQPFVYRLVERLTREERPLSRNRHFHTFESPEGREALRVARLLRSVARDIAASPSPVRLAEAEERIRLEIPVEGGTRTTWLTRAQYEILRRMPGLDALAPWA